MHLVDLEFSETLELDPSVSGGFGLPENFTLNIDLDVDLDINDLDISKDISKEVEVNPFVFPLEFSAFFPDEDQAVSLFVGEQLLETTDSIVVDNPVENPSVSQPLCL